MEPHKFVTEQGKRAFEAGKILADNPYKPKSWEASYWTHGFEMAERAAAAKKAEQAETQPISEVIQDHIMGALDKVRAAMISGATIRPLPVMEEGFIIYEVEIIEDAQLGSGDIISVAVDEITFLAEAQKLGLVSEIKPNGRVSYFAHLSDDPRSGYLAHADAIDRIQYLVDEREDRCEEIFFELVNKGVEIADFCITSDFIQITYRVGPTIHTATASIRDYATALRGTIWALERMPSTDPKAFIRFLNWASKKGKLGNYLRSSAKIAA